MIRVRQRTVLLAILGLAAAAGCKSTRKPPAPVQYHVTPTAPVVSFTVEAYLTERGEVCASIASYTEDGRPAFVLGIPAVPVRGACEGVAFKNEIGPGNPNRISATVRLADPLWSALRAGRVPPVIDVEVPGTYVRGRTVPEDELWANKRVARVDPRSAATWAGLLEMLELDLVEVGKLPAPSVAQRLRTEAQHAETTADARRELLHCAEEWEHPVLAPVGHALGPRAACHVVRYFRALRRGDLTDAIELERRVMSALLEKQDPRATLRVLSEVEGPLGRKARSSLPDWEIDAFAPFAKVGAEVARARRQIRLERPAEAAKHVEAALAATDERPAGATRADRVRVLRALADLPGAREEALARAADADPTTLEAYDLGLDTLELDALAHRRARRTGPPAKVEATARALVKHAESYPIGEDVRILGRLASQPPPLGPIAYERRAALQKLYSDPAWQAQQRQKAADEAERKRQRAAVAAWKGERPKRVGIGGWKTSEILTYEEVLAAVKDKVSREAEYPVLVFHKERWWVVGHESPRTRALFAMGFSERWARATVSGPLVELPIGAFPLPALTNRMHEHPVYPPDEPSTGSTATSGTGPSRSYDTNRNTAQDRQNYESKQRMDSFYEKQRNDQWNRNFDRKYK